MGSLARHPRLSAGIALAGLLALDAPARANEVAVTSSTTGLRVHDAAETLREFCVTDTDGRTWLRLPGGQRFELVTSTDDAAIANHGDGAFHPFEPARVVAALAAVRFPLDRVDADIFLLPYPRRDALDSGAGHGVILLSPGVMPLSAEKQCAELVHELGHVVQYQFMPDGDARWSEYRLRRGIVDRVVYSASAMHADRPHEIFAEDFRALFGGGLANYSGSIENSGIEYPTLVGGLADFMLELPGASGATRLTLRGANPARGAVSFALAGSQGSSLDVFDVSGRRVVSLSPAISGGEVRWSWNGIDANGRRVPASILLARARDGRGATLRFSWLP